MTHNDRALSRSGLVFCSLLCAVGVAGWGWVLWDSTTQAAHCLDAMEFLLEHALVPHAPRPRVTQPAPATSPPESSPPVQRTTACDGPPPRLIQLPDGALTAAMKGHALAYSARIVPSVHDGRPNGFKLYAIRTHSLAAAAGLCNGDTVIAINGSSVLEPDQAIAAYARARDRLAREHVVDYTIERRGMTWNVTVQVPRGEVPPR